MPHQCLKCGRIFQEGSAQLLKGCPDCGGNRFFFTKQPLTEEERTSSVITELMQKQSQEVMDKSGDWLNVKPKEIRKALEQHISEKEKIKPENKEGIDIITDDKYRKESIEKIESEMTHPNTPETINIEQPIIIQKDGSYTIHLPSIFKMIDKEKND
jgi:predicted  nucleic acid-binding Zn-ribbon protein